MVPSHCRDALRASLYRHHGLHRRDAASKSAPGESRFEFDSSSPPRRRPQGVSTVGPAGLTFQTPSERDAWAALSSWSPTVIRLAGCMLLISKRNPILIPGDGVA